MKSVTTPKRSRQVLNPSYRGFLKFCAAVGFELEPQQKLIARAAFGGHREVVAVVPKGQGKTATLAALGVHHLLSAKNPVIYSAASSREQGAILFEEALAFAE